MGLQAYQEIKKQEKVSNDPKLNQEVQEVGKRIAAISGHPDWDWQFTVFQDDEPNAFALPGGKVGVNTGLFKAAKTDAQLATVLGHEVGHAIAAPRRRADVAGHARAGRARGARRHDQRGLCPDRRPGRDARDRAALFPHPGKRGRPHRPDPDGQGRLRSAPGDRALAELPEARRRQAARVPLDPSLRGHAHPAPAGADARGARDLPGKTARPASWRAPPRPVPRPHPRRAGAA